jgi:hypothetical protein
MAENEAPAPVTAPGQGEAPEVSQTLIRWDGSKMRTTYANVCNVSSNREELTMLFGTHQNWHVGQKELTVELSDRIILNPYAAKRLALLLNRTMEEYERRFGQLVIDTGEIESP